MNAPAFESSFDFNALPAEQSAKLKVITASIQLQGRMVLELVTSIGQHLIVAKDMLEHGQFLDWLPTVGFTESTAQNYMNVTRSFGPNMQMPEGQIDLGALYVLATSKVADEIRDDYLKLVGRGEHIAADAARALRDAPLLMRMRYVLQVISGQQFLDLFKLWQFLRGSNNRCVMFRKLIEEDFTDAGAAKVLFGNAAFKDADVLVMASTKFLAFDGDTIPVNRLTQELVQKYEWQIKEPGDPSSAAIRFMDTIAKVVEIDLAQQTITLQWSRAEVGEIFAGSEYHLVIAEL